MWTGRHDLSEDAKLNLEGFLVGRPLELAELDHLVSCVQQLEQNIVSHKQVENT
jgi:hypothetical protein